MPADIRRVQYFYSMIEDKPGESFQILSRLASEGVNLLAFNAIPTGPSHTQLVLYPESTERLARFAEKAGMVLCGPGKAFWITGDDELGALVEIHQKLFDADINVVTSNGITDGRGRYGYLLHVRPENYDDVARLLDA